jgi:two-component system, LytTR family, response regulator LytT
MINNTSKNLKVWFHISFWIVYYLLFGYIWAKDNDYLASYKLEFSFLPLRILSVYCMIMWLIPAFLCKMKYVQFCTGYILLLLAAGIIQRCVLLFLYEDFENFSLERILSYSAIGRNIILINSTVLFVSVIRVVQLWQKDSAVKKTDHFSYSSFVEIKSNKRIYKVAVSDIVYIESLGNYIIYHLSNKKLISYTSLTESLENLPQNFVRVHKSFIVNKDFILSYNHEDIEVGTTILPIGRIYKNQVSFT